MQESRQPWLPRPMMLTVHLSGEEYREEIMGGLNNFPEDKVDIMELYAPEGQLFIEATLEVDGKCSDYRVAMNLSSWASGYGEAISEFELSGLKHGSSVVASVGSTGARDRAEQAMFTLKGGPLYNANSITNTEYNRLKHRGLLNRDGNKCVCCGTIMHSESMGVTHLVQLVRSNINNKELKQAQKAAGIGPLVGMCYMCKMSGVSSLSGIYFRAKKTGYRPPYEKIQAQLQQLSQEHPPYASGAIVANELLEIVLSSGDDYMEYQRAINAHEKKMKHERRFFKFQDIFARDGNTGCCWCGQSFSGERPPTFEHVIPSSVEGPDAYTNYLAACAQCNSARGSTPVHQWLDHCFSQRWNPNIEAFARRLSELTSLGGNVSVRAQHDLDELVKRHLLPA